MLNKKMAEEAQKMRKTLNDREARGDLVDPAEWAALNRLMEESVHAPLPGEE